MTISLETFTAVMIVSLYFCLNVKLSKEIWNWEPSVIKRVLLVLNVWLIPFIGGIVAYKYLDLDWLMKRSKQSKDTPNVISGALLEMDMIFNPGQKHVIEAKQKEHIEVNESGQLHASDRTVSNHLKKSQSNQSS